MNVIIEWPLIANTLLQNVTGIITKWNNYFITKYNTSLLQNVRFFITKCDSLITNCDSTLMLLVHKKNYQEIIKINIKKRFS